MKNCIQCPVVWALSLVGNDNFTHLNNDFDAMSDTGTKPDFAPQSALCTSHSAPIAVMALYISSLKEYTCAPLTSSSGRPSAYTL